MCFTVIHQSYRLSTAITFTTRRVWVDRHRFKFYDIFFFSRPEPESHGCVEDREDLQTIRAARVPSALHLSHTHTAVHGYFYVCVCACPSHVPLQSSRPPATTANHRPPPHGWSPWQRSVGHVTSVYSLIITGARSPSPQDDTLTFKVEALKEQWRCFHPYFFFRLLKLGNKIRLFLKNGNKWHNFSVQFTFNKYCVFFLLLRLCLLDCLYCIICSSNFLYFFFFYSCSNLPADVMIPNFDLRKKNKTSVCDLLKANDPNACTVVLALRFYGDICPDAAPLHLWGLYNKVIVKSPRWKETLLPII